MNSTSLNDTWPNMQTLVIFLHTISDKYKNTIKKAIPFTIELKKIKCLGICLIIDIKGLYTENHKKLMKLKII